VYYLASPHYKGLRDSEEERGEPQNFKFLLSLGVTATQVLTFPPISSRHYAGMMQDGLRIAGTLEGGGLGGELTRIHTPTLA
jgi:hypothetical protein